MRALVEDPSGQHESRPLVLRPADDWRRSAQQGAAWQQQLATSLAALQLGQAGRHRPSPQRVPPSPPQRQGQGQGQGLGQGQGQGQPWAVAEYPPQQLPPPMQWPPGPKQAGLAQPPGLVHHRQQEQQHRQLQLPALGAGADSMPMQLPLPPAAQVTYHPADAALPAGATIVYQEQQPMLLSHTLLPAQPQYLVDAQGRLLQMVPAGATLAHQVQSPAAHYQLPQPGSAAAPMYIIAGDGDAGAPGPSLPPPQYYYMQ
jgi:hypothetical protein